MIARKLFVVLFGVIALSGATSGCIIGQLLYVDDNGDAHPLTNHPVRITDGDPPIGQWSF